MRMPFSRAVLRNNSRTGHKDTQAAQQTSIINERRLPSQTPMLSSILKSTLIGFAALIVAVIAYLIILISILSRTIAAPPGSEVSFDLSRVLGRASFWLVAFAAFALGFYWEFRRTGR
jgi:hypothetical protein